MSKTKVNHAAPESAAAPDQRVVKAMSHPVRFRALTILNQRVASPKELAVELDESLGVVAYHVRILLESGALELVDTAQRRGAIEHYYRATVRPFFTDEDYARLPPKTRRALFTPTVTRIIGDAMTALDQGGFDDPSSHGSYVSLDLDEASYDRVVALLAATLEELMEIQADATNALAAGEASYARTQVGLLHHHRTPSASARA